MLYIDVRTKGEYNAGHVEGAILHDVTDMMQGVMPTVPKDAEIVLYCESGNRSMMAEGMMKQAGFTNVKNGGGINDIVSTFANNTSEKNWFNKVDDNIYPGQWPAHKVFVPSTIKGLLAVVVYFASFVLLDILFKDPSTMMKVVQAVLAAIFVGIFYYFANTRSKE